MLAHLYDYIQKEMNQYDYDIMVIYYDHESDDFSSFERIIKKRKVDGFIVLRMELSDSEMKLIEEYQVPCVFMMNASMNIRDNLNYLFSDSYYGGYLAGKYLGRFADYHKMFITVREETEDADRRFNGYYDALKEYGWEMKQEDIIYCNLNMQSAYECVGENIEKFRGRRAAVFTYSDILGIGVLNALKDFKIKVPEDVQLIGMDDIPLATWTKPSLSTIHVPVEEMVSRGCRLLMDLIEKKSIFIQEWVKPHLVIRETTMND